MQRRKTSEKSLEARTAYGRVRDALIQDILSGHLPPGTRLTIAPLTRRYGTSSTPVRAAIQELQGRGLITALPHHGARVRAIDEDYITNVYEVRRAILGILVPRCIRFMSDAHLEHVEGLASAFERCVRQGELRAILEANRRFHDAIYELAGNPEAFNVMQQTWFLVDALRMKFGFGPTRLNNMIAGHRAMIEALRRRDAGKAHQIFQDASDGAMEDLLALARSALPSTRKPVATIRRRRLAR